MTVIVVSAALWGLALWLIRRTARARPHELRAIAGRVRDQAMFVLPRLVIGVLGAGFYAHLLPAEAMGAALGPDSGIRGALFAMAAGVATPGGPIVAFSLAAVLAEHAGRAQILAYVSAWSLYSLNRSLAWELPMLGGGWVRARMLASAPALALIAGTALALF